MKKKILGIVLASSLVLSLGLVFAGPAGASPGQIWQIGTFDASNADLGYVVDETGQTSYTVGTSSTTDFPSGLKHSSCTKTSYKFPGAKSKRRVPLSP